MFRSRPDTITKAFNDAILAARRAYIEGLTLRLAGVGTEDKEIEMTLKRDHYLTELRFHDLRHEATSHLVEICPLHELTRITGHQDIRMLMRYYHPRIEDLAKNWT